MLIYSHDLAAFRAIRLYGVIRRFRVGFTLPLPSAVMQATHNVLTAAKAEIFPLQYLRFSITILARQSNVGI